MRRRFGGVREREMIPVVALGSPDGQPAGVCPTPLVWPAGWPSGDPNATTGVHLALTNATEAAAHPGAGATVWTTGGASA